MKTKEDFCTVGILVGTARKSASFRADSSFLKGLMSAISREGVIPFVFTAKDMSEQYIAGYIYSFSAKEWIKKKMPYPSVVFNRVPTVLEEQSPEIKRSLQLLEEKSTLLLNPSFFDKWDVYQLLSQNNELSPFLPETKALDDFGSFLAFLNEKRSLYIKRTAGSQGEGIMKVSVKPEGVFRLSTIEEDATVPSPEALWGKMKIVTEEQPYIMQEEIQSDTIGNVKFDFRISAVFDPHTNIYTIAGIGVRKASAEGITTHVPRGGEAAPLSEANIKQEDTILNWLADEAGSTLSDAYGQLAEFSMDVCRSPEGTLHLLEVNSKPMKFDEAHIQNRRNRLLAKLFKHFASPL
ncbi:hypothetical protein GJU40_04790 [Bacillus lacus]|uniref:ATP-grasp domain-containing protein n=1 Tax=Metabacillus lacus TaxID=1983721 RepID=A0A7X2IX84_9BACI|nr:YheC/YheD family protein [Metabacillus lacus]MRX71491.1 hypothetical protein [Metabacillus lacus]